MPFIGHEEGKICSAREIHAPRLRSRNPRVAWAVLLLNKEQPRAVQALTAALNDMAGK